jgi:hypothetical protein
MTCSRGTWASAARENASGSRSKRGIAIRTRATKTASKPNLLLYRTANNPPIRAETNVSVLKIIGNMLAHPLAFANDYINAQAFNTEIVIIVRRYDETVPRADSYIPC